MIDNMGRFDAELLDCVGSIDGISATGANPMVIITNRDPLAIDDYIVGNNNDYFILTFSGSAPDVVQEAFSGEVVTHDMFSLNYLPTKAKFKINPSPNSDLETEDGEFILDIETASKSGNIMLVSRMESRILPGDKFSTDVMVTYMVIGGTPHEAVVGTYDATVLGTGKTRVVIRLKQDTVIKSFSSGKKAFNMPKPLVNRNSGRTDDDVVQSIGTAELENSVKRNSIRGLVQKQTKLFNVNGAL